MFVSFFGRFFGLSYVDNHVICRETSYFFLSIFIFPFQFSCLIALARTFSMMSKERDDRGHSRLVSDLRKAVGLSPFTIMLAVVFW